MGPMEVKSISGHQYMCIFMCNYTSHVWVIFLKSKDKTLGTFKVFVLVIEKLMGLRTKYFHSDQGEFILDEFTEFLKEQGIIHKTSAPRTPQQNGIAVHDLNCAPQKGLNWRTPYELLFGRVLEVSYLCIFGYCVWVLSDQGKKWDAKAKY